MKPPQSAHTPAQVDTGDRPAAADAGDAPAARAAVTGVLVAVAGFAVACFFAGIFLNLSLASPGAKVTPSMLGEQRIGVIVGMLAMLVGAALLAMSARQPRGARRRSAAVWASGTVAAVVFAGILALAADQASGGIGTALGSIESYSLSALGQPPSQGTLQNGGMDVEVLASAGAASQWAAAEAKRSKSAVQSVMGAGDVVLASSGTHARLLRRSDGLCRVLIEDGDNAGKSGWVPSNEFVLL